MKNFSVKHIRNFKGAKPVWSIVQASSRAHIGLPLQMTHGCGVRMLKIREMNGRGLF